MWLNSHRFYLHSDRYLKELCSWKHGRFRHGNEKETGNLMYQTSDQSLIDTYLIICCYRFVKPPDFFISACKSAFK